MDGEKRRNDEVAAFVRGDPIRVSSVQAAVRATVRSFRFGNPDLERDLVQETLRRTLTSLADHRFQGDASLQTYARHVARYTCLEHIRRRRNEVAFDPELHPARDLSSAPEASFLSTEEHRRNLRAFASLPPDCREILCMICLDGASYREVAARLGVSEAALKSRIHRCRLTCREAAKPVARPPRLVLGKVSR
jgi:RNA polymerase sigma-70 factor (ECF subfamily)